MLKMKLRKKLVRSTPIFIQNTSFNILSTLTITAIIIITKVGYEYFACVLLQFVYMYSELHKNKLHYACSSLTFNADIIISIAINVSL